MNTVPTVRSHNNIKQSKAAASIKTAAVFI